MAQVFKIDNQEDLDAAFRIREQVFVKEQGVNRLEEFDSFESVAFHFLASSKKGKPIGTARWRFTDSGVKLERFAVIAEARKHGIGYALLDAIMKDIKAHPKAINQYIFLHAQLEAIPLYEKYGFRKVGNIFEECGIKHYKMEK